MARRKTVNNQVAVGNLTDVSGEVNIAGRDIYKGYTPEQVSVLVTQLTSKLQLKPFDGRCPYKGLEVFEEEDAGLFFGRERLVAELVGRVKESRAVFITGPSGSGKSSLVRAGLIHALKQGAIKDLHSERWLYETMKPGREPLKDLALAFSRLKSPELANYFQAHADEVNILNECAESVLSGRKDQRFVLFVDQFEEVFTQVNREEERLAFLNMLAHAGTVENGRVIVLFAMRSDFVSNCATYPAINELLSKQFRQIGAMQPDELVSAIVLPARHVGLPVEDELIARIINDMKGEPGALPLMQFALKDLFDAQQEQGGVIALRLEDYLQHGGIHKSLERHADNSFATLSEGEQELARSIFSGLIEIGRGTQDTRRTALFDELVPADAKPQEVEAIVQKLADARLVITDEQAGKDTVTISHEKLIDAWPWLKKLVNENRDAIALQNEIADDAKEWEDHQRDPSYLYAGARLVNAREQLEAKKLLLSGTAHEFVQAGTDALNKQTEAMHQEEARKQRLQRRITIGSISFTSAILVLFIFALIQLNLSRSLQLSAQAQAAFAEQNYNLAALYAYQANQIRQNDEAESILAKLHYQNFVKGKSLTGHAAPVTSVAWSMDARLASGSVDKTVIIWDQTTGKPAQILKGHSGPVSSVAWSGDGRLASTSYDNVVIVWDLAKGQPAQVLKGHEDDEFTSVAWSPDGRLASASTDNSVIIWDIVKGEPAQVLKGHENNEFTSVAWSPDGHLASTSPPDTLIIWDLTKGESAQILQGYEIYDVAWSANGQLASGSENNSAIIWDLGTGEPEQILIGDVAFSAASVAWSADGKLASAQFWQKNIIIWDVATGERAETLEGHTDVVTSVAWSRDGRLASGSGDNTVIIWDFDTGKFAQTLKGHTEWVYTVAWSKDGRLASGDATGSIILWDLAKGRPAQILSTQDAVYNVAWSADGKLASGSGDNNVIIWNLTTGQPAQVLKGHTQGVYSVVWSGEGRLASGSEDRTIILWDLATGRPSQVLKGHEAAVTSLAWSADGRLASSSYEDHRVIIWDLSTGKPAQIFENGGTSVAWSADGRLASDSVGDVIVWDLVSGQPAKILRGHAAYTNSNAPPVVAWSSDGRLASFVIQYSSLSSSSQIYKVIIWDLAAGEPAQVLSEHTDQVSSVAWSPDDDLASASLDYSVKIARADTIRGRPCDWIVRNLTLEEWLAYQGVFYVYQPVCSNLYNPVEAIDSVGELVWAVLAAREDWVSGYPLPNTEEINLLVSRLLITWSGRILLLGITLFLFMIPAGIFWTLRKLISWGRKKALGKEPSHV